MSDVKVTRSGSIGAGKKKDAKKDEPIAVVPRPSIIHFDEATDEAKVVVGLPQEIEQAKGLSETGFHITKTMTAEELCQNMKDKYEQSTGMSLYEKGLKGKPVRIAENENLVNRIKKWRMHGTDKLNRFMLKMNIELMPFYLAASKTSHWTFRVGETTTAFEITEKLSEKFDMRFVMLENLSGREIPAQEKILWTFFSWHGNDNRFMLKQMGPRVVALPSESLPLDIFEDVQIPSIPQLTISDKWKIDTADFKFKKVIGGGNYGKVILGTFKGETVAIKKMINTHEYPMEKYVQREIDTLSSLNHPNIIKFFGAVQTPKAIYIVTEFVSRGDLRNLLHDKTFVLAWPLRLKIAIDVASALEHFHSKGFIHRDLKSDNLLVQNDFSVKLCDLGLARELNEKSSHGRSMTLCGTDEWMAPEVIMGEEQYDASADIFSFGMVLVELLTRKKPPMREPRLSFAFPTEEFASEIEEECPSGMVDVTLHCVQYKPENRPNNAEILDTLRKMQKELEEKKTA